MKSLEIVNKKIEHEKEQLEFYLSTGIPKEKLTTFYRDIKNLEQIKQDLEVLEILRKHLRFMGENKTSLKLINNGCGSENCKLYKVKQWLEENENDR